MHQGDIDPTLCAGEPLLDSLDDGFSPPPGLNAASTPPTHPVEPDPPPGDDAPPNPSQLPVEPEFGQALPPAEPEDPTVKHPVI